MCYLVKMMTEGCVKVEEEGESSGTLHIGAKFRSELTHIVTIRR